MCARVCVRALELSAGFHRAETELVRFVISAVFGKPSWENSVTATGDGDGVSATYAEGLTNGLNWVYAPDILSGCCCAENRQRRFRVH